MVREDDDLFIEEDFVALQASVMGRLALDVFLFDHHAVVEEDDVVHEDDEECLEPVAGRLEETVLLLDDDVRLLLAERGWLEEPAALRSTSNARGEVGV